MQWRDQKKVRAHRISEAEAGFPLLRAIPATSAIRLTTRLDTLSPAERLSFATQLSDYADALAATPLISAADRAAIVRSLPLIEHCFGGIFGLAPPVAPMIDVRLIPVKILASVIADHASGGFEGWTKIARLSDDPAAQAPAPAHAASLAEVVPVTPAKLRKLFDTSLKARFAADATRIDTETTRYTARCPGGPFQIDISYARAGRSRDQFSYSFSASLEGRDKIWMTTYESLWLTPPNWDYVTDTNAQRSIAHFVRIIETCIDLT